MATYTKKDALEDLNAFTSSFVTDWMSQYSYGNIKDAFFSCYFMHFSNNTPSSRANAKKYEQAGINIQEYFHTLKQYFSA